MLSLGGPTLKKKGLISDIQIPIIDSLIKRVLSDICEADWILKILFKNVLNKLSIYVTSFLVFHTKVTVY